MTRTEQIDALVAEYNKIEGEQEARRVALYRLMAEGKGYRLVNFTGKFGQWSNYWRVAERFELPHVYDMTQRITEVIPGED